MQYDHLFKKELVQTDLAAWLKNAPEAIRQNFPNGEEVINDFRYAFTKLTACNRSRKGGVFAVLTDSENVVGTIAHARIVIPAYSAGI